MGERTVEYEEETPHVPEADFADVTFSSQSDFPEQFAAQQPAAVSRRSGPLRRELSARNLLRADAFAHEATFGSTPSIVYQPATDGLHGNFFPASYRRIVAHAPWAARLEKAYTGSRRMAHREAHARHELDCAASSDALLMNIFCHPTALRGSAMRSLLAVAGEGKPEFGYCARIPLRGGCTDRTEFDMRLAMPHGDLLVEAKLSETDFQTARPALVERYPKFADVFAVGLLAQRQGCFRSYQLLRSVMVAHHTGARYAVLLDARRTDLAEDVFLVYRAVQDAELRSRLHVVTWQETAACVPRTLQRFLAEKYGIEPVRRWHGDAAAG